MKPNTKKTKFFNKLVMIYPLFNSSYGEIVKSEVLVFLPFEIDIGHCVNPFKNAHCKRVSLKILLFFVLVKKIRALVGIYETVFGVYLYDLAIIPTTKKKRFMVVVCVIDKL